jgi:hypothetical protein
MRTADEYGNPYPMLEFSSPDFARLQAAVADRAPDLRLHRTRLDNVRSSSPYWFHQTDRGALGRLAPISLAISTAGISSMTTEEIYYHLPISAEDFLRLKAAVGDRDPKLRLTLEHMDDGADYVSVETMRWTPFVRQPEPVVKV